MIIDFFIPCFVDQVYPHIGISMLKIFDRLGVAVDYNPEQTCCGQMAFNSGYWDDARVMGEKFIRDFSNNRYIVAPSASCVSMVRNYYSELFFNTSLHNPCKQIQKNIYELTDFLTTVLDKDELGAEFPHIITYHDACAALREYGIKEQPRRLLSKVRGLKLNEMKDNDVCCGFGGTFSVKFEPISTAMGEQKVQNAIESGAEYIVSTEASCLMHLEGYISKHKLPIKTIHIADVLACGL
ncbi:MAG: (Fe-S)-binding protein [Bacteroidales bacterium]|jgi:L-lactate dehydrogenase complex protein LldE|nr:(Fe-S)-binding protein [Bacteroidales bacterium]